MNFILYVLLDSDLRRNWLSILEQLIPTCAYEQRRSLQTSTASTMHSQSSANISNDHGSETPFTKSTGVGAEDDHVGKRNNSLGKFRADSNHTNEGQLRESLITVSFGSSSQPEQVI